MRDDQTLIAEGRALMTLLKSAVTGLPLPAEQQAYPWENVYALAHFHRVANLAWFALEKNGVVLPEAVEKRWREERDQAVIREIRFNVERERIYAALEKKAIPFLPLKGIVMKGYYAEPGMRWMSDNDIWYDVRHQQTLVTVMSDLGYEVKSLAGNHDVFQKLPIFNFEMHKALFPENSPYCAFAEGLLTRLKPVVEPGMCRTMGKEDFYLYSFLHFNKHLANSGSGVRGLVDLYLLKQEKLNWMWIEASLEALGLEEQHQRILRLVDGLLGNERLDAQAQDLFLYILKSGVYGTAENRIAKALKEGKKNPYGWQNKLSYTLERAFPSYSFMCLWWPPLKKHPVLLPVVYGARLLKTLLSHRGVLNELKIIFGLKKPRD